jgi:UDP-2,3-diacylglucosamine pyrophosphatase LpxH
MRQEPQTSLHAICPDGQRQLPLFSPYPTNVFSLLLYIRVGLKIDQLAACLIELIIAGRIQPGAKKSSQSSRVYTSETKTISREDTTRKIRKHAEKVYDETPFNLIISGHVHVRDQYLVQDGQVAFKSVNLGTWLDAPCYYRLDETGGKLVDL